MSQLHISGIVHNTSYLRKVLKHEAFRAGDPHTGFLAAAQGELLSR